MKKIIYDVGAHNGSDIPYYLMKGDTVVAIEANPVLCKGIRQDFASEIQEGRLILENCVVTDVEGLGEVDFYLHNRSDVLSTMVAPPEADLDQYTCIKLPSRSILGIISSHGLPYYIKIDIELYDVQLLKAIFAGDIRPPFISAESHSLDTLSILAGEGHYKAFKLVDGYTVCRVYSDCLIETQSTQEHTRYSFPLHSAGPFGNDIDGEWLTFDSLFRQLAFVGLGWKDIHASNVEDPAPVQPRVISLYRDEIVTIGELLSYTGQRITRLLLRRLNRLRSLLPY